MNKDWINDLMLIVDLIPPNPEEFARYDVEEQVKTIRNLGFNTHNIAVADVTVGEAGIVFFQSTNAECQRRDLLKEYCDSYKKYGGNALVYYNVHWLSEEIYGRNPEWFQKDSEGNKITINYGNGGLACINSEYRGWIFSIIKDIGVYDIKGIFLDGPFFDINGCFCKACSSKFMEQNGYRLETDTTDNIEKSKAIMNFRYKSIEDFVRDARTALKSVNLEAILYMNNPHLGPDTDGRNNWRTSKWHDLLLAEGGFFYNDLRSTPIWRPAASAKLLESQAEGKPYIVAIAGRLGPWTRYLISPSETWLAYAEAIANGANIWYGVYDTNRNDNTMNTVKKINTFLSENSKYLTNTKSTAKVALVWSYKTANYYQTSRGFTDFGGEEKNAENEFKSDAQKALNGWYEVLHRSHCIFDIIDDHYVEVKDLSGYELLILPNIACMGQLEVERLKDFVSSGGNIISTFDTSFYDETGIQREELLLKDLQGIELVEGIEYLPYGHIEMEESLYTEGIKQPLIPAPHLYIKVKAEEGVQALMHHREKQEARYCDLPSKTPYPYIVINKFGSGKSVLFTGNIDVTYDTYRLPELLDIMRNTVYQLSSSNVYLKDSNIMSVDINIRRKDDNTIVHLINYTSPTGRPISNVIPLKDIEVSIRLNKKPTVVKSLKKGKYLPFSYENEFLKFIVPEVNEYEIVSIR